MTTHNRGGIALLCLLLVPIGCGSNEPKQSTTLEQPVVVDEDGDGSPAEEDCDDADASRTPGAIELCDGVDNDCDASTDDAGRITWLSGSTATDLTPASPGELTELDLDAAGTLSLCEGVHALSLVVTADVDIQALDGHAVTLDGGGEATVVEVAAGATAVSLSGVTITGGTTGSAAVNRGGGLHCHTTAQLTITDTSFVDNQGASGAGMGLADGCEASLVDVVFEGNEAAEYGGGIHLEGGSLTLTGVLFDSNVGPSGGGAIWAMDADTVSLTDVELTNNEGYEGGGLGLDTIASVTIIGGEFNRNAAEDGGAIWLSNTDLSIEGTAFVRNAAYGAGGGIASNFYSDISVDQAVFDRNSSRQWGGAARIYSSTMAVTDSTFTGNSASWYGGALASYDAAGTGSSQMNVFNSAFSDNSAGRQGGALAVTEYSSLRGSGIDFSGGNAPDDYARDGGSSYTGDSNTSINCPAGRTTCS